ncbi:hypothetical protein CZ787_06325 [Halomonas citrativorans]|uniref:Uncharacterized protein n=1 Tax=Halomonas citrativorans TaxID=2742612 RepID=A0A1R4HWT9_9GAMM|nr:hypothetical protein [Halomonas citrativorans]SJN11633.1 hypothetical protein CZ787_06325 [Halomonas citrativorans]
MLQALIAFVTILSGYLFITKWHESRYIIRRQDSQGVYFYAAAAGIVLLIVAISLVSLFDNSLLWIKKFLAVWAKSQLPLGENEKSLSAAYWIIVLSVTLLMGLITGYLLNYLQAIATMRQQDWVLLLGDGIKEKRWWNPAYYVEGVYKYSSIKPLRRAINHLNADFELILFRGFDQAKPICFTLHSGKVYVGQVMGSVDPVDSRDMIRILPMMSGYRDDKTHKITFTTFYKKLYERLDKTEELQHLHDESFEIVFSFADVQNANLFDTTAYDEFQKDKPENDSQLDIDFSFPRKNS